MKNIGSNRCIDNNSEIIGDILRENIEKGARISILTAYFTIYAFDKLRKELEGVEKVKFLLTNPLVIGDAPRNFKREYEVKQKESIEDISGSEWEIQLRNKLNQTAIARECAKWIERKADIKCLKEETGRVDSRFICIENKDQSTLSLQGVPDFTAQSLGYVKSGRIQMAIATDNYVHTKAMLKQFDEIWANQNLVGDIKPKVIALLEAIYQENSPEFLYFLTLFNIFKEYLGEIADEELIKSKTGFQKTQVWDKLYKYQKDGVLGAIEKIERYNGCILADSVGLGKTFEALAVIKYYELRNFRVLVLCPKRLRENWTIWTRNDIRNPLLNDRFRYDTLNHTDLSRTKGRSGDIDLTTINWGNYDLVVIDESHNFRNDNRTEGKITRYQHLMEKIIKEGVPTRVLLLSATPLNTRMKDLENQIAFMTKGTDDALNEDGIPSISQTLRRAQATFNIWMKLPEKERNVEWLLDGLDVDYFHLLDKITIARSRKHIQKYYKTADFGTFPKRLAPKNEYAQIDIKNQMTPLSSLVDELNSLQLAAYSPLQFVHPVAREKYSEKYDYQGKGGSALKQQNRERGLINLMRSILLKRLESSVYSFRITLERTINRYEKLIDTLDEYEKKEKPETEYSTPNELISEFEEDEDAIGEKVKVRLSDIDLLKWRGALEFDLEVLHRLHQEVKEIDLKRDAKLARLKEVIREKVKKHINPGVKKILIFSAYADTAEYLYVNLADWLKNELDIYTGLVSGGGKENQTNLPNCTKDYAAILVNFSPQSKERARIAPSMKDEIDVLIGTDCISEGQNLQDCDTVINYDIHWNPVRIIQRFGRIDRLGSKNDKIQLINFWPSKSLDEYIKLIARVEARMLMGDTAATGSEVIEQEKGQELAFRKKQLEQLREKVLDLEDMSGSLSITDLTFNDFKMDLAAHIQDNENLKRLQTAPLGMYAIANRSSLESELNPGVIFVLKHRANRHRVKEQNSLHPYYLVYINEDGQIKHGHTQAKHVLDIFKLLAEQKDVQKDLVKIFDKETKNGSDMNGYSELLSKTVENILDKKQEEGAASLFGLGESNIVGDSNDDFELVSFLIVK